MLGIFCCRPKKVQYSASSEKVGLEKLQINLSVSGAKKKITAASGELGISFADEDVAVL